MISHGKKSTESAVRKLYTGIGSCYILGVNLNKAEIEKVRGFSPEDEPNYLSTVEDKNTGEKFQQIRLEFIAKPDPDLYQGVDVTIPISLFLTNKVNYNKDKTKLQVMDKYGRTCWVTVEEFKNKEIPIYKNGPANIDREYHACLVGEEDLINFIISYLDIDPCQKYVNGSWIMNKEEDLKFSIVELEHITDYFKGNVSEIKEILSFQPNNKLKVCFGVRTADTGQQYPAVYTRRFYRNKSSNFNKLAEEIETAKANGAFATTEFSCEEFHEYVVESTNFAKAEVPSQVPNSATPDWGS